ncbi:hypothetical protein ACOMHN_020854 [Nucella lapillus]
MNTTLAIQNVKRDKHSDSESSETDGAAVTGLTVADNEQNAAEQKEKLNPDSAQPDDKESMIDSKTKFINGGNTVDVDDTKLDITKYPACSITTATTTHLLSDAGSTFTGLSKDELKKYEKDPFWVHLRWALFIIFWVGWVSMLVAAIIIIALAPRCPHRPNMIWYQGDVHYNIYSKSFFDGRKKQDGYGDLEGIQKKMKYISSLNANTLWLSSIIKTEGNDDRAVLDHRALDEKFGTLASLKAFCKKLAKDGKRIIMDLIPNQTSRNHTWFTRSQKRHGKYADYYVWADRVAGLSPNNWEREDGSGKMWVWDQVRQQYYLGQFEGTADLNLTNKHVMEEFKKIMQFWEGHGISGFHVNDLEYLTENPDHTASNIGASDTKHFADNAIVVDALRRIVDGLDNRRGKEKLLMGTVSLTSTHHLKLYGEQKGKRGLHVVAVMLDALTRNVTSSELRPHLEQFINGSTNYWMGWKLTTLQPGSHRMLSQAGKERMTIAHALQALLPGSSLLYYGDEIAMEDGVQRQRKTVTPMQWSKGLNAGFTKGKPWLPVNDDYPDINVDTKTAQLRYNRMTTSFKFLNKLRASESLQFGETIFCSTDNLLMFTRHAPGFDLFLVVINLGQTTGYNFADCECVMGQKKAKLVFHSHSEKLQNTQLDMDRAIIVGKNEVLVLRFPR